MIKQSRLKGIFEEAKGKRISYYTQNYVKKQNVYGEKIINKDGKEYREWDPYKSKLGAAIYNKLSQIGIKPGIKILYLGAATGTTCSHVSDIINKEGELYALDFAPRTQRQLVFLSESRDNMVCLLEDANRPDDYCEKIPKVDVIFQDVAQKQQAEIFIKNIDKCLKEGGFALLAVKSKSIDIKRKPKAIFNEIKEKLENKYTIVDQRSLEPYEKDHWIFVVKK
ncbi:MAG: fibrillarin-like rRNA/tRNA 2'-O-methyltransferase [Nanobdellota archaeon]